MTRSVGNLVIWFCLALGAVALGGAAPPSRNYHATDFFADPKVAELAEAAARGDVRGIDALIAQGVDVNARGREGATPLLYAMTGTTAKGFQRLLERGADPNQQADNGDSAMSWAAGARDPDRLKILLEMLKMLLAHGGNPNLRELPRGARSANLSISRPTAIYHAGSHEIARILIKGGADVDVRDDSRGTPMMWAALCERFDVVYALLAAGADFRLENMGGTTLAERILDCELDAMSEQEGWRRKCIEFMEERGMDFQKEKAELDEWSRQRDEWLTLAEEKEKRGEHSGWLGWTSDSVAALVLTCADFPQRRCKYHAKDFFADPKVAELAEAAARGDVEQVDTLVAQGVDVNARGEQGLTPLLYAMSGKEIKGFQRLLQLGADPNRHMDNGESAMKWAAYQSQPEHLKMLLAHGGDPNLRYPNVRYPKAEINATPLHWAVQGPNVENARILIDAGADPRARDANGNPLVCAARDNRFDMVYAMLEAGADFRPEHPDRYGLAQWILLSEVEPDSEGEKWRQNCTEFLLEKGVDFEKEKRKVAEFERRSEEKARQFAEAVMVVPHTPPWPFSSSLGTILFAGDARTGRKPPAKQLFADPKVAELAEAAAGGHVNRVDTLVAEGVDVNARGEEGLTPLIYAMTGTKTQGFERLLQRGADPNAETVHGESAMHWAGCQNESEHLKTLLAHGGDANVGSESGFLTPIYWAVNGPSAENVRILIQAGADVNVRDATGDSPLKLAIGLTRFDMAYILLEGGADFREEVRPGDTLGEFILHSGVDLGTERAKWREKCIEFMEKKGADFQQEKRKVTELFRRIDEIAQEIEEDMKPVRDKRKRSAVQDDMMSIP